jgi:hypothetical protein
VLSLLSALYAVFVAGSGMWSVVRPLALAAADIYAARYMDSFWADKAKVPLMDEYNAAISESHSVISLIKLSGVLWAAMGVLRLFGY